MSKSGTARQRKTEEVSTGASRSGARCKRKKHLFYSTKETVWCWRCGATRAGAPRTLLGPCGRSPRSNDFERAVRLPSAGYHPKLTEFFEEPR